jgi:Tol biopolymer transport system component
MSHTAPSSESPPIAAGTRLGRYQIIELIGQGGMGYVYRATDTSLDRDVAVKVLPDALAHDAERRRRLESEARIVASLNHPNIVTLHAVEDVDGRLLLAMELVRGLPLSALIPRDGLPLARLLAIAVPIAEGLSAAHALGIIHRDLKPGNVMVGTDGTVKVLDFGIAKRRDNSAGAVTETLGPATAHGDVVGTVAYMSPEQAQGLAVDARSDVFSFGVMLYEMATGRRPFTGATPVASVAEILRDAPAPVTALNPLLPKELARVIRRALAKDPARRPQSGTDLRNELDDIRRELESGELAAPALPSHQASWRRTLTRMGIAAAAVGGGAALGAWLLGQSMRPEPPARSIRFEIQTPANNALNLGTTTPTLAMAPDGRTIAYITASALASGGSLVVRSLDELEPRVVAGVARAREPFFSPDGQWIGYQGDRGLEKVPVGGGEVRLITETRAAVRSAAWVEDDTIVFSTTEPETGLLRVSSQGGSVSVLTTPDAAAGEADHFFPTALPEGRGFLFTSVNGSGVQSIAVFDGSSRVTRTLIPNATCARYTSTGHLIYASGRTLYAAPFDLSTLAVSGDPIVLVDGVLMGTAGCAYFATSRTGVVAYVPIEAGNQPPRTLVWVDRTGVETPLAAPPRAYEDLQLSPSGTKIAVSIAADDNDVWVWDLQRDALTRVTADPARDRSPVWTPDERHIVFSSGRSGAVNLYRQAADGSGPAERLTMSALTQYPTAVTPDGRYVFGNQTRLGPWDLFRVSLSAPAPAEVVLELPGSENYPAISPNARFIAYSSNEAGRI